MINSLKRLRSNRRLCIIDCGTSWLKEIIKSIEEVDYPYKVVTLKKVKVLNFDTIAGVIISGAPVLLSNEKLSDWLIEFKFIRNFKVPILGICLGHQIIGLFYGANLYKGTLVNRKEKIELVNEDFLFNEIGNHSLFREEHSEYITLPKNFVRLAKSLSCENEAMKHRSELIYGVQFHPEVSGVNGRKLFSNFCSLCNYK
ncbi:MAG: gamma-glutamyl-gamma-aminobutyrate hydrolase family protein [Patescibacteria group bacterium]|nr:gamma-glutamyl-gamma-aminobutyrate hydrolase family protein [Patescibacteria group bacterium]